ncbi:DUF4913 domain-containing protein [Bifidobacterium tsurumiense]|uniref:DUF4913 domain-containing protein n=1 Tax=Bifidobacterium tsurumiense TaxID=356829 RepID=A0A087E8C1_9BIFI|nr:DUF4913 domain-containing protein [Bifidobacterium tsurumiense]KFJ04022.1 hypothetical protein BITS_1851 [Bifidobacterium tsurumiense]
MDDMTNPTGAEDASGGGAVMDRAVRAARDLLATLAESGEGVSLVTILTKAVLENRAAKRSGVGATQPTPAPPAQADGPAGRSEEPAAEGTTSGERDAVTGDGSTDVASGVVRTPYAPSRPTPDGEDGTDDGGTDPETEERYDAQMGARVSTAETFYPSLPAFVECFLAHVFPFHQSASSHIQWVPDWWRHPALVLPLDAIWRSYETARRSPGQMMIWYIQASSMLDRVFDKDRGIVASLDAAAITTVKGAPLPCERPGRAWRAPIVDMLSVPASPAGHKDDVDNGKEEN